MKVRITALVLMAWLTALDVSAGQAITIRSFRQTLDHIPGDDRRNDLNDVPCAVVKVQVTAEIDPVANVSMVYDPFVDNIGYRTRSLVIEEGIESIASYSFWYFPYLSQVSLPQSVNIGRDAFRRNINTH